MTTYETLIDEKLAGMTPKEKYDQICQWETDHVKLAVLKAGMKTFFDGLDGTPDDAHLSDLRGVISATRHVYLASKKTCEDAAR